MSSWDVVGSVCDRDQAYVEDVACGCGGGGEEKGIQYWVSILI